MARPRKYATDAERQKAYRERRDRLTDSGRVASVQQRIVSFRLPESVIETIRKRAASSDVSTSEMAYALLAFALTNVDWGSLDFLLNRRLPRAPNPIEYRVESSSGVIAGDGWRLVSIHADLPAARTAAQKWAKRYPMDTVRVTDGAKP